MKNETTTVTHLPFPPPPQKKNIKDDTAQKPKCTIFPSLFEGEEV